MVEVGAGRWRLVQVGRGRWGVGRKSVGVSRGLGLGLGLVRVRVRVRVRSWWRSVEVGGGW